MTLRMVLATRNRAKALELLALLEDLPVEILAGADFPDLPDVAEEGGSFEENALAKAQHFCSLTGFPALADDSGLEVDALGGEPGVRSARFGGPGASDGDRISLLLSRMAGIPAARRTARFRCALAFSGPSGECRVSCGCSEGSIAETPRGTAGFGYDPVFVPGGCDRTFAELSRAEKNQISHRARAVAGLRDYLAMWLTPGAARG